MNVNVNVNVSHPDHASDEIESIIQAKQKASTVDLKGRRKSLVVSPDLQVC